MSTDDGRIHVDSKVALVVLGVVAGALLVLTRTQDPGLVDGDCPVPVSSLPLGASQVLGVPACRDLGFLLLDVLLIAAYGAFLWTAWRWAGRCLGWRPLRRLARSRARFVVLAAPLADVVENAILLATRYAGLPPAPGLLTVASTLKLLGLALAVPLAVFALLVALRRWVMPWTVPPAREPTIPAGRIADPIGAVPATNGAERWFVGGDGKQFAPAGYGVGLSGGGIRSAAFCSGVVQALAGTDWSLDGARYLATVSGGGYLGTSMQGLRHAEATDPLYADQALETRFLARHHRYLGTGWRVVRLLVAWLMGVLLNILVVGGVLALAGVGLAYAADAVGATGGPTLGPAATWSPTAGWSVVPLVVSGILWHGGTPSDDLRSPQVVTQRTPAVRLRSVALAFAVPGWLSAPFVLPLSIPARVTLPADAAFPPLAWVLGSPTGVVLAALLAIAGLALRRRTSLLTVVATLWSGAWVTLALTLVHAAMRQTGSWWFTHGWGLAALLVTLLVFFSVADQTSYSPHPFYKGRLAGTFAVRRKNGEVTAIDRETWTYLDEWGARAVRRPGDGSPSRPGSEEGPELLVCATANTDSLSVPPRGTRAVPFVFAHDYVGSPELGWWATPDFRRVLGKRLAGDGTLQAAMAISGAAVASRLGHQVRAVPSAGTGLALLNARLGVWLPNPRWQGTWPAEEQKVASWWRRTRRPALLLREVAGVMPPDRRFVYVSDGGHLENLGLVELLRRRCRVILLVDATNDPRFSTGALDRALAVAMEHLGVTVLGDDRTGLHGVATNDGLLHGLPATMRCTAAVRVEIPAADGEAAVRSTIVLAKAAFAADLVDDPDARAAAAAVAGGSRFLRWFPWSARAVPKVPTPNQWLTDRQFRALVRLGRAVGRQARMRLEAARESVADAPLGTAGEDVAEAARPG